MKSFFGLFLFVLTAVSISAQKNPREVNLLVNGIGSGSPYSTVIRKFGKPLRKQIEKLDSSSACSGSAETHLTLFYSGLEITLLGDGKGRNLEVYSVEVTSKKWLASGISVGANVKTIETKFGITDKEVGKSKRIILRYVTKDNLGVVNFYFQNNKLVKIVMAETLC